MSIKINVKCETSVDFIQKLFQFYFNFNHNPRSIFRRIVNQFANDCARNAILSVCIMISEKCIAVKNHAKMLLRFLIANPNKVVLRANFRISPLNCDFMCHRNKTRNVCQFGFHSGQTRTICGSVNEQSNQRETEQRSKTQYIANFSMN